MKRRHVLFWIRLTILLLIPASAVRITPASAQAAPALAVDPAEVNLPLGEQFVIKLTVTDGVDVNGFDIKLTYDQGRLSLLDWAQGDYLESLSCVKEIKSPGLLELECAQEDGQPAASGDGVLLELSFDTLALGTSDITLEEAVFVDYQGLQTQPERANGLVNVQNLPTWTPTATVTSTHTLTVTLTPTQVPPTATTIAATDTPTLTPSPTLVQGQETPTLPGGTSTPDETATLDGAPTKTLITPISGVAGPSQRTGTTAATLITPTPKGSDSEDEMGPEETDGSDGSDDGMPADQEKTPGIGLWGRLLLCAGVFVLVVLVVLILLRIRQRKRENEDLLL